MRRRSVPQSMRRHWASQQGYCALVALCLWSCAGVSTALADSPTLQAASPPKASGGSAEDVDAMPPLEPPASPPVSPKSSSPESSDAESIPPMGGNLATALARTGDLTLRNSSLDDALFTISELWGINVVVGDVNGTVNGVFKDAPLREILDSILLSNGYGYRPVGDSLVVSPIAEVGNINPFFNSATIPVYSADIDEVVEGARLLSTPQGQIRPMKSARSLFVLDYPDRVQVIRQFVTSIDGASRRNLGVSRSGLNQPLEVGHFRTQYIAAKTAAEALQAVISKDGRIGVLEKEDRLIVTDYAENLSMVAKVLQRIDRPRPQVRITALIYDLSLEDVEELGINWNSAVGGDPVFQVDSVMKVPYNITPANPFDTTYTDGEFPKETGSAFTFLNLSPHFNLKAVVEALQTANDARLLANPHVAVLENEEAKFESVREIPYQQLTQTQAGGNIGTTAFKNAGITLTVQPKISAAGTIQMRVTPVFSRLTGFTPGENQPIIDTRTASTVLSVANRQIIVIGGLRQRDDVGDFTGIPYLKDVAVVGRLFRARNTNVRESELVVFIMPEIIGPADPLDHRNRLVADTTRFRLDQIPEPEGAPPCYTVGGAEFPSMTTPPQETGSGSAPLPVPEEGSSLKRPASESKSADGAEAERRQDLTASDRRVRALVADGRLRRLPPVAGGEVTPVVAAEPPAVESHGWSNPLVERSAMRPDYDRRFRATGGISPLQQRAQQNGLPPEAEEPKKEGFWSRMLPFWR